MHKELWRHVVGGKMDETENNDTKLTLRQSRNTNTVYFPHLCFLYFVYIFKIV